MVATVRSLLPTLVANGITTAEEVDIDTLEDRLQAEWTPYGLANPGTFVGCYALKP